MNKYSIRTTILIYMSVSAALLVLALGFFVVFNHTKSLEGDLLNKMHIMSSDIIEHKLYEEPSSELKNYFLSNKSYHKESYGNYVENIKFYYTDILNDDLAKLSISVELPEKNYLVIESSSKGIDVQIHKLLFKVVSGLTLILSLIILGLYLLLKKLLYPLRRLVDYCNDASSKTYLLDKCSGNYEVNALREAILVLENSNHMLCKEKQNIFREAAHEIKTPIAILKARLALFDKSDMPKDEFIENSKEDIAKISNKLRELIFLKAIEWDILQDKESVQMQNQCSMMQQLFKPIMEKKSLNMVSNIENDFELYIYREAIGKVMQAIFENIFMHTKNGTTIQTYIDAKKHQLIIVNEIGQESNEVLFSSHIGTKIISRLAEKLEYEYTINEKDGFFHTTITFKGQNPREDYM